MPAIDGEAFKAFERNSYSDIAGKNTHKKTAHVSAQAAGALLDGTRAGIGVRLLDVACGPGLLSAEADETGRVGYRSGFRSKHDRHRASSVSRSMEFQEADANC